VIQQILRFGMVSWDDHSACWYERSRMHNKAAVMVRAQMQRRAVKAAAESSESCRLQAAGARAFLGDFKLHGIWGPLENEKPKFLNSELISISLVVSESISLDLSARFGY
jgi:hypothetical protein